MSRDVAIVDLDGTIFSRNSLDVGHLNSIRSIYDNLIIVSNNSSLSHLLIESFLSSFTTDVLTPQLLGRALFQAPSVLTRSCCLDGVNEYFSGDIYSRHPSTNAFWIDLLPSRALEIRQECDSQRIGLVGKNSSSVVKEFVARCQIDGFLPLALNVDRTRDSLGIKSDEPLVGDLFEFQLVLNKTCSFYLQSLLCYLDFKRLRPVIVYGDNELTDGLLAKSLGIDFELMIFGSSQCSCITQLPS